MNLRQGSLWGLTGLALVAATVWALWPAPLEVDLGEVAAGPMRGTVLAEGSIAEIQANPRVQEVYLGRQPETSGAESLEEADHA